MQTPNNESKNLHRHCRIKDQHYRQKSGKTISILVCGTFLMNWGEHIKNKIV